MKTMKTMKVLLFSFSATLILTSCEGPAGADGIDGADGNANVRVSVANNINWDETGYPVTADLSWSAITEDIIDNGVVLSFWQRTLPDATTIESPLPYVIANENGYVENVIPIYSAYSPNNTNNIGLVNLSDDGIASIYDNIVAVKFVVIEGTGKRDYYSDWTWEDVLTYYPDIEIEEIK